MPPSITLSELAFSTPDGTPLFVDLTLAFGAVRTGLVGRNGTGKTTLLRLIAGELRPQSGGVSVAASLGLMRQGIGETPGETIADLFGAGPALALIDKADAGGADAADLAAADWTLPARIETALLRFALAMPPSTPLAALSGGQRTRAGLAAMLFAEPDFILLDEPTNNLDRAGRRAVIDFVHGWRGGAIIVSHDRQLLEAMDAIVELGPLGAARYGGNYSFYRARQSAQLQAAVHDFDHAQKAQAQTLRQAQQAVERKARRDSAGRQSRVRGDKPKIMMDAAKGRAEASGGANARLRDARGADAAADLAAARTKVEIVQPLRMDIAATGLGAGKAVLALDAVTGGYDSRQPIIRNLSFAITGPERIALSGANGTGKTTLLSLIAGRLAPLGGRIRIHVPFAFLDQDVALLDPRLSLRDNFLRLSPSADENQCRAALARFRFRADDGLQTVGMLSGGQRLRAGLACTLGQAVPPPLLILDEPTNHLDIDATEAIEAALATYDGALLVVSHDDSFLANLALTRSLDLVG